MLKSSRIRERSNWRGAIESSGVNFLQTRISPANPNREANSIPAPTCQIPGFVNLKKTTTNSTRRIFEEMITAFRRSKRLFAQEETEKQLSIAVTKKENKMKKNNSWAAVSFPFGISKKYGTPITIPITRGSEAREIAMLPTKAVLKVMLASSDFPL